MNLEKFFLQIAPFLEGGSSHEDAVLRLFGKAGADSKDARRLAIYGRFCRAHRFEALDSVYASTRACIVAHMGRAAWDSLVEEHFRIHPMTHPELNENGARFAEFLRQHRGAELPRWIEELAELEWWDWRTANAPDTELDARPEDGPLRMGSTVELRPFEHDLVTWLETTDPNRPPESGSTVVIFWRDLELRPRFVETCSVELLVLKLVYEGHAQAAWSVPDVSRKELDETVQDLKAAGILLGQA